MNARFYKKAARRERLILTSYTVVYKCPTAAKAPTVFRAKNSKPRNMRRQPGEYLRLGLAVCFLVSAAAGEDKWVWSRDRRGDDRSRDGGTGRFDDIRARYDVTEPTTRRPGSSKPQADEFSDDFPSESPRYNFNAFGRPGPQPGFGPLGPQGSLYPNPQNGILVGPGGPTGIIGRPPLGGPPINRPPLKGNPANGILVGPGGPTGIIGRPPQFGGGSVGPGPGFNNNLGPQVFPTVPGPQNNPPFYPRPGAGQYPGPGGYPTGGGVFPGGGFPPRPGAYPGGYPTGAGFLPGPGQSFYPGSGRGPEGNYYLTNFGPFRSRSNGGAFDEIDERSVGKSSQGDRGLNRNILKKSVR